MSFGNLFGIATGIVSVTMGIAAFVSFIQKNYKNKSAMITVPIVALTTFAFLFAIFAVSAFATDPQIAINHNTGISLPGLPAPTESNNNTVVVVTQPPTQPPTTKTYKEERTLICISTCTGIQVKLDTVVINVSHQNMTWNFTITNNGTSACSFSDVSVYLEDPAGTQINGAAPGTLTDFTPLNAGQTLQEYTTIALVPQPDVVYTLHATPNCNGSQDTDQVETFQFN